MLTTLFVITKEDNIQEKCDAITLNSRLIKKLDPSRHVSLLLGGIAADDLEGISAKDFDRIYEAEMDTNIVSFLARSMLRIDMDQILYLDDRVFTLTPLSRAFERNMNRGIFLPKRVLDFRGYDVDPAESWQAQQLFARHTWPVISAKSMLVNKDDISAEFLKALDLFAEGWEELGKEYSDGAMAQLTWDNLVSFTCFTHENHYIKTELLNYRSFARRDFAKDKNWVSKDWYDWLDTWWVTKDAFYLRIENFRQYGMVELTGDCITDMTEWLEKSNG